MAECGLDLLEFSSRKISSGIILSRQLESVGCDPKFYAGCISEIDSSLFQLISIYPYRNASDFSRRISVDRRCARVFVAGTGCTLRVRYVFRSVGGRFFFAILIGC
jgi:hypothetical protein